MNTLQTRDEELLKEKEKLKQQYKDNLKKIERQRKQLRHLAKINNEKDADKLLALWARSLLTSSNNLNLFELYVNSLWEKQQEELFKKYKVKMQRDEAIQKATDKVNWIKNALDYIKKGLKEQQEKVNNPVKETKNI